MGKISKIVALSFVGVMLSGTAYAASSTPLGIPNEMSATKDQPSTKRPVITQASVGFGAYDPHGDFGDDKNSKIEHLFLPWEDVELGSLTLADDYALKRGRTLLISVEPWSWSPDWRISSPQLLQSILNGERDVYMAKVCTEAAKLKSPVIIRWAQEMDETDNQFTWAHWQPDEYVKAYQRMVRVCRESLPNAKYMWSPKGNEGLQAFYPGDDYVDIIGLSVFGYQKYDRATKGGDQTFSERLAPGYDRVKGFGKPIWVAELGYDGDASYIRNWAENVARTHPEFPELKTVVYFNDREVYPWPDGFGKPEWRVVNTPTN
ncbi:glycoside hydrolase family 26 protein [Pseudochrobactrum asaccharolyticum]|uniref:Beta-mannanase n=1 Tax=Pseudochrobactrum asaccharolyticum TaxID=354351 RepID=A0A366DZD0_9HYPH|nr:glycoside hydrolase family 26 protein [Pseudochrobactrum asaccharolyticum]RBO95466.1 beta-mannanase [Pseudochrobactrum asaccharolyticum]